MTQVDRSSANDPIAAARRLTANLVLPVLPALALLLAFTLRQLDLPGLYYDEALDLTPMLTLLHGGAPELLRGVGFGRFPIMLLDYMGSLAGYMTLPFLAIFGPGVAAARVQPIFFSALTLFLAHAQTRRWFGPRVAWIAVTLLAAQPSYVWFTRQGISVTSVMTVFAWGGLLCLTASGGGLARTPGRWGAAGLLFGLGLWAKLPFLWWLMMLAMMAGVYLLTRPPDRRLVALRPALLAAGALGFLMGAAPLLYYNAVGLLREGDPYTFGLILGSLLHPTRQFGVDNRDFVKNINTSWSNFKVFVDGSYFWYNGVTYGNVYALPWLGASLLAGAALAWRQPARWRWLVCALALGVAIFMGAFTVSGQWATHFFIIAGLPQILLACAAVWLAERLTRRAAYAMLLSAALLAVPFYQDVWVDVNHHSKLAETGGSGRFSDAVYKIAAWLDEQKITQPVALDWGIDKQIRLLTNDRVRPLEIFGYAPEPDDAFRAQARALLRDPARRYVLLADQFAVYNRRAEFTRLAGALGRQINIVFIAHERSGLPVYVVIEAR